MRLGVLEGVHIRIVKEAPVYTNQAPSPLLVVKERKDVLWQMALLVEKGALIFDEAKS